MLQAQENLTLFQQSVDDLLVENDQVCGVITQMGVTFRAKCIILTVGTFLGGKIHIGLNNYQGGRAGDAPSNALSKRLRELPFRVGRLKTGTPPRIDAKTVDFSVMQTQPGDTPRPVFSYLGKLSDHPKQIACYITHTNEKTHEIIRNNLHRSPMYSGEIEGIGPRYCPSIEDKIVRFADKNSHQIFVEPEGLESNELYPNGISTSLPFDVQLEIVRSIKGFENAHICRPGYAIEYDFFDPRDLKPTLETKHMKNLFFAGQINGTTGYEEAAAQGLLAGLNAALIAQEKDSWYPSRSEAYIGVLVDDLITNGTMEPYRMFTSRAEYRLLLREDNADLRLTPIGRKLGLVDDIRFQAFEEKQSLIDAEINRLRKLWVGPKSPKAQELESILPHPITADVNGFDLLKRPEMTYEKLMQVESMGPKIEHNQVCEQIEIQAKYDGYITRQKNDIEKQKELENMNIPSDLDYNRIKGLSNEVRQKLMDTKPTTIAQASRIPGVTTAAISLLLIYIKKSGLITTA